MLEIINTIRKILGISHPHVSHTEKIVSSVGGFLAILSIFLVSQLFVDSHAAVLVVTSMGASAVLLFAVPHGKLSQPWSVFGGHLLSAFIGVICAKLLGPNFFAASLAVGIAIGVMYYLHCIHPPGGATALSAVIGGETVHELGYQFLITPVLFNVLIIIVIGVLFNVLFHWRRYPAYWHNRKFKHNTTVPIIAHEDFVYALSQIDSFIDVSEHDLQTLYGLATKKSQDSLLKTENIVVGGFYSNGKYGKNWSVRQIVDESQNNNQADDIVIYKIVAGDGRRNSGYSTRKDFLHWAKHRVIRDEENWKKFDDAKE